MDATEKLQGLLDRAGMLVVSDALALGVSAPTVYAFARRHGLQRVVKGVYASDDAWIDDMHVLALRSGKVVFSHESALLLHDLTDREPTALTVTVPAGYNASTLAADGVKVHYIRPDLHDTGKVPMRSPEGNDIPCYDLERTMCDIIRSRSRIEGQIFTAALQGYVRRPDKRLDVLDVYATKLGIGGVVTNYLEVLL
ncbi:type IV toxin-antitoxin system AbiEi family antitoxin domain-containing protein [Corynebacterium nasicanis]|uniref:Abortive phage infection protein n=1 Tax=Corynebacterium nasicanis TaxID=1448267 RepID=A0ABW1QB00_9CORY